MEFKTKDFFAPSLISEIRIADRFGTKNPTQKTHCKKTNLECFFSNKSILWSIKRLGIVLGYIHAFQTMNNNLNNLSNLLWKNKIHKMNQFFWHIRIVNSNWIFCRMLIKKYKNRSVIPLLVLSQSLYKRHFAKKNLL